MQQGNSGSISGLNVGDSTSTSFETSKSEDVNERPLLMFGGKFDSLALAVRDTAYKINSP